MRPFLFLISTVLMLFAACNRNTPANFRLKGNWRLISTNYGSFGYHSADSVVVLSFYGDHKYEFKENGIVKYTGTYRVVPDNPVISGSTLYFNYRGEDGNLNKVSFSWNTMQLEYLGVVPAIYAGPLISKWVRL